MDKVQNNESLFSVEELEQRLEMTAPTDYDKAPLPTTEHLLPPEGKTPIITWYFG